MNTKTKYVFLIAVFFLILLYFFIFHIYMPKHNSMLSEEDKKSAFQQMKTQVEVHHKEYQILPEQSLLSPNRKNNRRYVKKDMINMRSMLSERIQIFFDLDPKTGTNDTVQYINGKLKIRTEEYVSIFDTEPTCNSLGVILKVTVSGRGRISPTVFYDTLAKNVSDHENVLPPRRISSLLPRDYYFCINVNRQPDMHIGLLMRGSLDITNISYYNCTLKNKPQVFTVIADVVECSDIPDPGKAPYPDCLFTTKMKGGQLQSKVNIPSDFILVAPAFKNRKKYQQYIWKKGDRLLFHMVRWKDADPDMKSTQQSDTLDDFDSERFALETVWNVYKAPVITESVSTVPFLSSANFSKYVSGYARPQNPPLKKVELQTRQERITAELAKMREIMKGMKFTPLELNAAFELAWEKNKKKCDIVSNVAVSKDQKHHYSIQTNYEFYAEKDMTKKVKDIQALSQYFLFHGINMIMVVCPYSQNIAAYALNPGIVQQDYMTAGFVTKLLENDVEALYFGDELLRHKDDYPLLFEYPFDSHPAHGTQLIAAKRIGDYIRRCFPEVIQRKYGRKSFTETLQPYADEIEHKKNKPFWDKWFNNKKPLYPEVLYNGKFIRHSKKSPVLLFGNSFLFTPAPWDRPYMVSLLVRELGIDISVFSRQAENPLTTCLIDLLNTPEQYLKDRKIVIFYYGMNLLLQQNSLNIKEIDQLRKKK